MVQVSLTSKNYNEATHRFALTAEAQVTVALVSGQVQVWAHAGAGKARALSNVDRMRVAGGVDVAAQTGVQQHLMSSGTIRCGWPRVATRGRWNHRERSLGKRSLGERNLGL